MPKLKSFNQEEEMKKLVIIMMLLAFVGVNVAIAADSYTYDNKKGTVTFNHKAHQEQVADCAKCHEPQAKQMAPSHHATAGEIMASLDNMLPEIVGGRPDNKANMASGCWQCHGSVVGLKREKNGTPLSINYPTMRRPA